MGAQEDHGFGEAIRGATLIAMNCPRRKTCGAVFGVFYPAKDYKDLRVAHISKTRHTAHIKSTGDEIALWQYDGDGKWRAPRIPDNCIISVRPKEEIDGRPTGN